MKKKPKKKSSNKSYTKNVRVVITVQGGVAEVTSNPLGIPIHIKDLD